MPCLILMRCVSCPDPNVIKAEAKKQNTVLTKATNVSTFLSKTCNTTIIKLTENLNQKIQNHHFLDFQIDYILVVLHVFEGNLLSLDGVIRHLVLHFAGGREREVKEFSTLHYYLIDCSWHTS